MATMRDVVTKALRASRVIGAGETPTADDAKDVLDYANGIFAQFSARNVHAGISTVTLEDDFPLQERHRIGFTAYLAKHFAHEFGQEVGRELERQASLGWQLISADYFAPEHLRVDAALQTMPSQRRI